jgi:hypothetical protein
MIEFFVKIFKFFKNPLVQKQTMGRKDFLYLFSINFLLIGLFAVIRVFFENGNEAFEDIANIKENYFVVLLLGTTVVPVYEEILHRIYLYKKKLVFISIFFLLGNILFLLDHFNFKLIVYLIYLLFLMFFSFKNNFFSKNIKIIVYLSIFFYSLFHLFNYDLKPITDLSNLNFLLFLFPQIIFGFVNSFVIMVYGIRYAVFFHAVWNLVLLLLLFPIIFFEI